MRKGLPFHFISVPVSGLRHPLFFCAYLLFLAQTACCHAGDKDKKVKKAARVSAGGSILKTHLRNSYSDDVVLQTFDGRLYFGFSDMFRFAVGVERQPAVDLKPEWLKVNSLLFDMQGHLLSYFPDRIGTVYGIAALSCQRFSGCYTGYGNIPHLRPYISAEYRAIYFGVMIGFGLEFKLYRNISVYGEARFRVIWSNEKLGRNNKDPLMSEQLGVGLKLNLPQLHKIFRKPGDKYHWF